jgi:hypothetical protein
VNAGNAIKHGLTDRAARLAVSKMS